MLAQRKTASRASSTRGPNTAISNVDPEAFADQYGMIAEGDCMAPEFNDGDTLWFDKNEPFGAGDNVIIFLRPEIVPPGAHQARVKRLVLDILDGVTFPYEKHPDSNVTPLIVAEMLNPPRQFIVKCSDVLAVHRCMGILPEDRRRPGLTVPAPRLKHTEQHVSASWPEQYVEALGGLLSRRAFVRSGAAAALAAGTASVAIANQGEDAELRRLWAEYQELDPKAAAAWADLKVDRDAFERSALGGKTLTELGNNDIDQSLRDDYRKAFFARPKNNVWAIANELSTELNALVRTIRATPAEGLFGLAVKLTALPAEWEDYDVNDSALSALGDINRILGTEFTIDGKSTFEEDPDDADDAEEGGDDV